MSKVVLVDYNEDTGLFVRMIGYEDCAELAHWGPCRRRHHILHFITKGSGFFCDHRISEGQGFYITPNLLNGYHSSQEDPWNYFWLIISKELAERFVVPCLQPDENGIFLYSNRKELSNLIHTFLTEERTMNNIKALSYFFSLLAAPTESGLASNHAPLRHVQNAKDYILTNLHRKLTVSDVAKAIHIDDRYLYNIFTAHEGISPKQFINDSKIREAKQLLCSTELSITTIALSLGFPDVCIFSRFFSDSVGTSPLHYRKAHQKSIP